MVAPLFKALVDDAAVFPPGNAALAAAVRDHGRLTGARRELVGPFLCPDQMLPELEKLVETDLRIGVIVSGGAGAIGPALTWADRAGHLQVAAVEAALRDEPELARNARRVAMAFDTARADGTLGDDTATYVEVPRTPGWQDALDVLAETGDRAKFRTGGDNPPTEQELAAFIEACLDRELPFKCTAGLHHAVRNTDTEHGFEQHGFLNVLVAVRQAIDGASADDLLGILAERDGTVLAQQVAALTDAAAVSTRRWFGSFGSCSITEPVEDLVALDLLERP